MDFSSKVSRFHPGQKTQKPNPTDFLRNPGRKCLHFLSQEFFKNFNHFLSPSKIWLDFLHVIRSRFPFTLQSTCLTIRQNAWQPANVKDHCDDKQLPFFKHFHLATQPFSGIPQHDKDPTCSPLCWSQCVKTGKFSLWLDQPQDWRQISLDWWPPPILGIPPFVEIIGGPWRHCTVYSVHCTEVFWRLHTVVWGRRILSSTYRQVFRPNPSSLRISIHSSLAPSWLTTTLCLPLKEFCQTKVGR